MTRWSRAGRVPQIVDELFSNAERPTTQLDLCDAILSESVFGTRQHVSDVLRVRRRADGGNGHRRWDSRRGLQDRRSAQRVTKQDFRSAMFFFQPVDGGQQVRDVAGEARVLESALALPKPGEIEPQHSDTGVGHRASDIRGRLEVLRTGKAMRKQRVCPGVPIRHIKNARQGLTIGVREGDVFALHILGTCGFIRM